MEMSIPNTRVWDRVRLIGTLIRLGRNPEKTDLVFDLSDRLFKMKAFHETAQRLGEDPAFQRMAASRKLLGKIDLEKLSSFPKGSLGHTYAWHMLDRKLKPDFYREKKVVNDATWAMMWLRQTHDLWHVATGFDTDPHSEVGLQAFTLTQLATPLSAILVAAALLKAAIREPSGLGKLLTQIVRGVVLANSAKPVFSYAWDENWGKPLAEVRKELNLVV